ncbi:hypothetical protein K431DRAFT_301515 [Polychaeton citri CBS 116435]|uniref:Increased recombination centers protein 6 n=1 Tax=Polychaeton citri CBS 116435 TaxID=1314669 RepID=A0A9P4QDC9_9PEZI|nr:hypothetical protein K431DRAFT_301515 [Polychaeton citri CBS 116435]
MDIKHPKRILILGPPNCGALDVIKALTGSVPQHASSSPSDSVAGLTHEWNVRTAYYSALIPIWIDEIVDLHAWRAEFLKPEAKEVVEAVGGWIFCFRGPVDKGGQKKIEETLESLQSVVQDHNGGEGADNIMLCVRMPPLQNAVSAQSVVASAEWEDVCFAHGFEYIDYNAKGTNEFGERVGSERLREALEAHEWDGGSSVEANVFDAFDLGDDEDALGDFSHEEAAMTAELFGLKASLLGEDNWEPEAEDVASPSNRAKQVDNLDKMMGKLLAIKEQSSDLPEAQRKRMAAQAVRELMREAGDIG